LAPGFFLKAGRAQGRGWVGIINQGTKIDVVAEGPRVRAIRAAWVYHSRRGQRGCAPPFSYMRRLFRRGWVIGTGGRLPRKPVALLSLETLAAKRRLGGNSGFVWRSGNQKHLAHADPRGFFCWLVFAKNRSVGKGKPFDYRYP